MASIKIKVDFAKYQQIKYFYLPYVVQKNDHYLDFRSEYQGITITGYLSSHEKRTISFRGENALEEAHRWGVEIFESKHIEKLPTNWLDESSQIGSDEVGVGDFLLPMIVVAAYVNKNQIKWLKSLGIDDSKKLSDKKIKEIGPEIVKNVSFSKLTLKNEKYNEMYLKNQNINSLKAKMHNRALANLVKQYPNAKIFIDEFASENLYYSYLDKNDEPIIKNIIFKTKGESYFPSVAAASVIARYSLILEKEKLNEKYQIDFDFGASSKIDIIAKNILQQVGQEEFDKLVKKNFKNYKRVLEIEK